MLAIQGNSVYFKTENMNVHFVDLDWLKSDQKQTSNKSLIMQPIFKVQSVIYQKFEYDLIGNNIATWVDPYIVKVFQPLNYNLVSCVGSHGVEQRALAWTTEAEGLGEYNHVVSALDSARGEITTWNLGSGKI